MSKLSIAEYFYSIQGEGPFVGQPSLFLRLAGCNLQCVGHRPGVSVPYVRLSREGSKKLKDVQPGDRLAAYDEENDELTETVVQSVFQKEKKEWLKLEFETGTQKLVGHEHLFCTTDGWKEAQSLDEGDEILWYGGSDLISLQKRLDNPMQREEVVKEKVETQDYEDLSRQMEEIRSGETWSAWDALSPEKREKFRKESSERMKGDNNPVRRFPERNPFNDSEIQKKARKNADHFPNTPGPYASQVEKRFHEICEERGFDVRYVGDGKVQIEADEQTVIPDFELPNGDVIEVYCSSTPWYDRGDDWESERRRLIEENSEREVVFVDVTPGEPEQAVDETVEKAPLNGITVTNVEERSCEPYCDKEYLSDPLEVYDLVCEPYPTFLLDTGSGSAGALVTHNCGAVGRNLDDVDPIEDEPTEGASWICDTIPEWKEAEFTYSPSEFVIELEDNDWLDPVLENAHIVLTGGEPTLPVHQQGMRSLCELFDEMGSVPFIEVETNGTIVPQSEFDQYINQYNVSLKLSNSGHDEERRLNDEAIEWHVNNFLFGTDKQFIDSVFKFVVGDEGDVSEIKSIVDEYDVPREMVMVMPAGQTREQLSETYPLVAELCKENQWRFSPRVHVSVWNEQTGV